MRGPVLLVLLFVFAAVTTADPDVLVNLTVDTTSTKPLPHYWSECVGSGHGALWLRADWQQHLAVAHQKGGFRYVRGHGILDEDVQFYSSGQTYYNVLSAYSAVLAVGMKPLVELSFTPNSDSSGGASCFHYKGNCSPPKDLKQYETIIQDFVQALTDHFGEAEVASWKFEVYNEPDLQRAFTQQDYFQMYAAAARAVKAVSSRYLVGGPASSQMRWLPDMANFSKTTHAPLDFLTTHSYPSDTGKPAQTDAQFAVVDRGAQQAKAAGFDLYMTEWSSSPSSRDPYHDTADTAAYIVASVASLRGSGLKSYSYWTFSDVFAEEGIPENTAFHGGFGMINLWGVPKPSLRAFELLNALGAEEPSVTANPPANAAVAPGPVGKDTTLTVLAGVTTGSNLTVILANHKCPTCGSCLNYTVPQLTVQGFEASSATIRRIDQTNTNPLAAWEAMGSPHVPTPAQIKTLTAAGDLIAHPIRVVADKATKTTTITNISVPANGVAAITLVV